ncbi:MAG: DMT family transporter [Rhodospirillales bacterium]|nr:DMT family transporter [Rhodospirillales bacterium]MBN8926207.1 DMT family transporter [Rhodospirillales bacterium]
MPTVRRFASLRALPLPSLSPTMQAMAWMAASGFVFAILNAFLRLISMQMDPLQVQFLRYAAGLLVMTPFIMRVGLRAYAPNGLIGQLWRGVIHTAGMVLWYMALPHLTLADTTAIGFTGPIFVMAGAVLAFGEKMVWERWVSAGIGFVGVLIVVGPKLSATGGFYDLLMLGSAPLFAASALITKALTKRDRPEVIVVWQCITISLFSLPAALLHWSWPSLGQWVFFLATGVLGSAGHYCVTRALGAADATASQSVKFLDLIWMTFLGLLIFGDQPTLSTLIGGLVIVGATTWLARRESRARRRVPVDQGRARNPVAMT